MTSTFSNFSSRELTYLILSSVPIDVLPSCSCVCILWNRLIKYLVPIPLLDLRLLVKGELVYYLPTDEEQTPRGVLLQLNCVRGRPTHIEIQTALSDDDQKYVQKGSPKLIKVTSVDVDIDELSFHDKSSSLDIPMPNLSLHNSTRKFEPSALSLFSSSSSSSALLGTRTSKHLRKKSNYLQSLQCLGGPLELQKKAHKYKYQYTYFIQLDEINFIMEGHWTPTFMNLNLQQSSNEDNDDGSEFFHRNKSFSIVTNGYKTFDLICFHTSTRDRIVKILRSFIYQTPMQAKSLAIFAQVNRKYTFSQQQKRRYGCKNTLLDLEFDTFVAMFENCIGRIENNTSVKIPYTALRNKELSTEYLFGQIKKTQLLLNEWSNWIEKYLINWMHECGLLDTNIEYSAAPKEIKLSRQNSRVCNTPVVTDHDYVLFEDKNFDQEL